MEAKPSTLAVTTPSDTELSLTRVFHAPRNLDAPLDAPLATGSER